MSLEDEIRQEVTDDWVPVLTIGKPTVRKFQSDQVNKAITTGTIDVTDPFIMLHKFCWAYNVGLEDNGQVFTLRLPDRTAYMAFVELFPWILNEPHHD